MSTVCDLLVVGAGPAGMAAASTAARLGVSTLLVDEQAALGGQIYRNVESHSNDADGVSAADWQRGAALVREFRASGARHRAGTQVWQLDPARDGACKVYVTDGTQADVISARRVLLATGAMERPVPIPGWTLPGVMTVGAAQILYKTGKHVPQAGTWIAGSGPLLWLFAAQALEARGKIEGILDTAPRSNFAHALRHSMAALRGRAYLERGLALQARVRRAGVPVIRDVGAIEAKGDGRLTTLRFRAGGRWRDVLASTLLLHHGVVPNVHATRSLRAQHRWDGPQRCFVPVVDAWGMTSAEAYAVAGDGAGSVGAEASALRGRLAALESARRLGVIDEQRRDTEAAPIRGDLARHMPVRAFLDQLFAPRASLLAPADEVLVCRCESITAGRIRDAVRLGCVGPNQMKAFTRCGMGPCQARMCGLAAAEIIARERGVGMEEVGVFNVRPPLKPLSLQELAALPE
jgi:NADPH-dependent 2,4-dienoyl-CoA reductase/sulfur reductase-like enzyme